MNRITAISGNKGFVFVWIFKTMEQAVKVMNKLPYVKVDLPYATPRPGTQAWIIQMPNMQHPDGTTGAALLVTGGFLSGEEAEIVMKAAKEAGSLDGSIIMMPKKKSTHQGQGQCLDCGTMVSADAVRCSNCGRRFV